MTDRRGGVLPVLFAGVLMEALDIAMLGPALPAIRDAFAVDDRAAAWVFGVFVLFNLVATPLMAKLSDRFGRRVVYAVDVVLFAAGSIVVAAAPSFAVLLAGRAVQGLAAGGTFPVASAVIGDVYPPERRGRALGLIGAVFGVAFLIGPILGGILLLWSWRLMFLVSVPIAATVAVLAMRRLPGPPTAAGAAARRPFDVAGMLLLAAGLAALALGLNRLGGPTAGLPWAAAGPLILLATAPLALLVLVERRAADPVIPPSLFRSRNVLIAALLSAGAGLGEAGFVFLAAFLVAALGITTSSASFMLLPLVIAMGVGAPVGGRLLDRVGARAVALGGTGLMAVGMAAIALFDGRIALFYGGSVALGIGLGALLGSVLRYVMLDEAPPEQRGAAQGLVTIFISIGQLTGSAALGAIIASGGAGTAGYRRAYLLIAALAAGLIVVSLGLRRRHPGRGRAARSGRVP